MSASREDWSAAIPDQCGLWQFRCGENSDIAEYAAITSGEMDELYVHEGALGVTDLARFHNGLTNILWKKIA